MATTHRSIRIANQQELQQRQQRKQQIISARRNSGSEGGSDEHQIPKTNNSPSPRTKHNRKQAKGNSISISICIRNWMLLLEICSLFHEMGPTLFSFLFLAGRTKSIPSTTSETCATTSNNQQSNLSSASFLLPKMQAEQGSIGELQKYHSRYLKNRRHTLANVR